MSEAVKDTIKRVRNGQMLSEAMVKLEEGDREAAEGLIDQANEMLDDIDDMIDDAEDEDDDERSRSNDISRSDGRSGSS